MLRLTSGSLFADDFEIVRPLAEGGMGAVYVAKQISTGKERALKIMRPQFAADARTRERFTQEARAGSQVDSEHVVEVVAAGIEQETQTPWLAMEYLRGEDLASYLDMAAPLEPPRVLDIFRQLCHGLAAAHESGLVHRDLKPENIFLATARRVGVPYTIKILDFGIAKTITQTRANMTDAVGTPTWMAPEQTEIGRPITSAADVWALGLIAFSMLTGMNYWRSANTHEASAMAILREVAYEPLEPPSIRASALGSAVRLTPAFDGWFARCVHRDPERRYPDARAALAGLERAFDPAFFDPIPPTERAEPTETVPPTLPAAPPFSLRDPPLRGAATTMPSPAKPLQVAARPPPASLTVQGVSSFAPRVDVDTYQRRLSRGRWVTRGALAAVLAASVGAGWRFTQTASEPPRFSGVEREPNNRAPHANAIPFGERVRGQLAQRLDENRSDIDFFEITVPSEAHLLSLEYRALPNIAPCLLLYKKGRGEPIGRYCLGQPGRTLFIPALRFPPATYIVAVTQDREQYTESPPPPILENVSDAYSLLLGTAAPPADVEVEPNDAPDNANSVTASGARRGKLAWMRDTDVFCAELASGRAQLVVEESPARRPKGAVLQVTPIGGPEDGIPVRVHAPGTKGRVTERDVVGSWIGKPIDPSSPSKRCVALTLVRDVWSAPPLPRVPAAGDQEYSVRLELL